MGHIFAAAFYLVVLLAAIYGACRPPFYAEKDAQTRIGGALYFAAISAAAMLCAWLVVRVVSMIATGEV